MPYGSITSRQFLLERPGELARYLPYLHVIAEERPVVISELGLAEAVYGAERQAQFLQA
jgi:hypothetical protein